MKTVKYRVTTMVGYFNRGDVIDVLLYIEGVDNEAVILHPREEDFCACLEIVVKGSDGVYYSKHEDAWMNLPRNFNY